MQSRNAEEQHQVPLVFFFVLFLFVCFLALLPCCPYCSCWRCPQVQQTVPETSFWSYVMQVCGLNTIRGLLLTCAIYVHIQNAAFMEQMVFRLFMLLPVDRPCSCNVAPCRYFHLSSCLNGQWPISVTTIYQSDSNIGKVTMKSIWWRLELHKAVWNNSSSAECGITEPKLQLKGHLLTELDKLETRNNPWCILKITVSELIISRW